MSLGKIIKTHRIKKGISVKDAASKLNVSRPYLANIESGRRGNPSLEILKKMSDFFEIDYNTLLFLAGYEFKNSNDEFKRIHLNTILVQSIEAWRNVRGLDDSAVCSNMNINIDDLENIKNKNLSFKTAESYLRLVQELKEQDEKMEKAKHKPIKFVHDKRSPLRFYKTSTDALGPRKRAVSISIERAEKLNHLDMLLNLKIDHYWKEKKLSKEDKDKITSLLDIIMNTGDKDA